MLSIDGTDAGDTLTGGHRGDNISGLDGDDSLQGNAGGDTLRGGDGDDLIIGNSGRDALRGEDGNDTVDGGDDSDDIDGGPGDDLLVEAWLNVQNEEYHYFVHGDTIDGGTGNDTIDGARGSDRLGGQTGDDVIRGSEGNDSIGGGGGNDTLSGGAGSDWFSGGAGDDFIYSDTGINHANGGAGADIFLLTADGTMTIYNFNAAEGDRLIVDGDRWERGDFYLRTDADAQIVGPDNDRVVVEATILFREGDGAPFREVAEIRSLYDMDELRLELPSAAGVVIAPIVWDLS